MKTGIFAKTTGLDASPADLFRRHERPGASARLVPPWERVGGIGRTGGLSNAGRVILPGAGGRWVVEHLDGVPDPQFRDVLLRGRFPRWEHTHRMHSQGEGACLFEDRVKDALPGGSQDSPSPEPPSAPLWSFSSLMGKEVLCAF